MSDATATPTAGMGEGLEIVGTLSQRHLTPPGLFATVKALPKGDRSIHKLGIIFGRVRGLSLRSNRYGDGPALAFIGVFEGLRAEPGQPRLRSNACFLPAMINANLASAVLGEHKLPADIGTPKPGQKFDIGGLNEIVFAVEIAVQHDDSEVGYRYVTRMHGEDTFLRSDPLKDVRKWVPGAALKALPSGARDVITEAIAGADSDGGDPEADYADDMGNDPDEPGDTSDPLRKSATKPAKAKAAPSISDKAKANTAYGKIGKGRAAS